MSIADVSKSDDKTLTLIVVEVKLHAKELLSRKLVYTIFEMKNHHKGTFIAVLKNVETKTYYRDYQVQEKERHQDDCRLLGYRESTDAEKKNALLSGALGEKVIDRAQQIFHKGSNNCENK